MVIKVDIPPLEKNLDLYARAFKELSDGVRPDWIPKGLTLHEAIGILGMVYYAHARTGQFTYPEREEMERLQLAKSLVSSQLWRHQNGGYDHFERDSKNLPRRLRGICDDDFVLEGMGDPRLREKTFASIRDKFDDAYQRDPTGMLSIAALAEFSFSVFSVNVEMITGISGSKFDRVRRDYKTLLN